MILAAKSANAGPPSDFRRGACPSIDAPMRTGDGLLVRFRPDAPALSLMALRRIAELSARFGNGILEITARGNMQVRGLSDETAISFAKALRQTGFGVRTGLSVEIPPLAGIDPAEIADPTALARRIEERIEEPAKPLSLAPKLSIIADGGGTANLSELTADIRLDAVSVSRWRIAVAGNAGSAMPVAVLPADEAVEAVLSILEELDRTGPTARGRDLDIGALKTKLGGIAQPIPPLPPNGDPNPVGTRVIGTETVLGIKLRYGRVETGTLEALLDGLETLGTPEIRTAHGHALILRGLAGTARERARRLADDLGFITQASDPANTLSVCTGAIGCASGTFDTRRLADALLAAVPGFFDGSFHLHVSGCQKGCAHPAPANLTLSGRLEAVGLIKDGRANDPPLAEESVDRLIPAFEQLDTLVRHARGEGETSRDALGRIAPSKLAAIFQQGRK